MDVATWRAERLRSHRLTAPAATVADAAGHMLATQAQEFWGGRWALAQRTRGAPPLSAVDAAFDRGEIVRTWTMRGTIHVIPAQDVAWVLSLTAERQTRQGASTHRREGIDDDVVARAAAVTRAALRGGNRLTRRELFDVLERGGVATAGQRGYHLLTRLSMLALVVQGPVVPREGAPTREQHFVLAEEWIRDAAAPADPLAELFARYIAGHGPAGVADFAWWSGLTLTAARQAAEAASSALREVEEGVYVTRQRPRRSPSARDVLALPPFEEYYISYADRTVACDPGLLTTVGPGVNGMVKGVVLASGRIVGTWTRSVAVGRHTDAPIPQLLVPGAAADADVAAALDRYAAFIAG